LAGSVRLLIPAAGQGARLGAQTPKALAPLAGEPLLVRTLRRLAPTGLVDDAVIVTPASHADALERVVGEAFPDARMTFVPGGAERQHSVMRGLDALDESVEIVAIHDAARPFVAPETVLRAVEAARECGAATVAIPSTDTILVGDADGFLVDTPDRSMLWACQTPQVFRVDIIREAHARAAREGWSVTDDATLVRRLGARVRLVTGSPLNLKVTTPEDYALAEAILAGGLR